MPIIRRKNGPVEKESSQEAKAMGFAGVPGFYWNYTTHSLGNLVGFDIERKWYKEGQPLFFSPEKQQHTLKAVFEGDVLKTKSLILGVGSYPTDEQGMVFGAEVIRRAIRMGLCARMFSVAHGFVDNYEFDCAPDVVVLYNLHVGATAHRIDIIRGWLSNFDGAFIVAVVAGGDPGNFFYNKLNFTIHQALYFQGDKVSRGDNVSVEDSQR